MKQSSAVKLYLHRNNNWHPDEDFIIISASIRYCYIFLYFYTRTSVGFAIVGIHLRYTSTHKRIMIYSHAIGYPVQYVDGLTDVLNGQMTINDFIKIRTSKRTLSNK